MSLGSPLPGGKQEKILRELREEEEKTQTN
jgi:hypothetical protein